MVLDNKSVETFKQRADTYNSGMNWVMDSDLISPLVPKPFGSNEALEICAGTGVVSYYCNRSGWNMTLIDSCEEMLKKSQFCNYLIADMHNLPFDDLSFDLVICRQGLQYANLNKIFQELKRVCRGQLRLAHITKEPDDDDMFWEDYFRIVSPGRKNIFVPNQIEQLACKNGFTIESKIIIRKQDSFFGPLIHMNKKIQNQLYDMLQNTTIDFKKKYGVKLKGEKTTYNNRWEFLCLSI